MSWLIGIDGGGTSCRAVLATPDGDRLSEGLAGPANIVTDFDQAQGNILSASMQALKNAGLSEADITRCFAFLGLAGANIGDRGAAMAPLLPFAKSCIDTDARVALHGALEGEDGAVAIVGTGSVFVAQIRGKFRQLGGWGFAVGDLGSGARLGRTLLQEVLLAFDKVHRGSPLTEAVMADFTDSPQKLVEYAQTAKPSDFGTFAPLIFEYAEQEDPIAVTLLEGAVRDVEENLGVLIQKENLPFCLLGGLAPRYSRLLSKSFKKLEKPSKADALQGALSLAIKEFGSSDGVRFSHHG